MPTPDDGAAYRGQNRATLRLFLWTAAWLATVAIARFGPELLWDAATQQVWSSVAIAIATLASIAWIAAFARFLREQDDLWRKILLEALALTLGISWIAGLGYALADGAGLVTGDVELGVALVVPGVIFTLAVVAGRIRYR
ncbi:hypothetical protein [Microbacterium sp. C7(2022)]|uniref:hypothetical protein n=1 Tax=Microbacterium sp. C7(2022) TaxID=2992759 RepID=UPI00237C05F6|nr:hypothetical protein [Microbacterium sp. C7(2022)]MDE0546516.1 hypothetical protein [Microbacterium sp. C7(2022)]